LVYGSWAIIAMVILYGRLLSFYGVETQSMRVALVQPNIEQDLKWSPEKVSEHFDKLLRLTRAAAEPSPDLIVWPETAFPVLIQNSQRTLPFSSSIPVLVGAVTGERGVNRNSALLLEGDQIKARFDKIHLVPFGEYVPLENWLPFEKLVENVGRFVPGTLDQQPLQLSSKNVKMGPLICYEDTFTRHSVRHARQGAQLLVNMTNDAWYGKSSALKQHADMAHLQVMSTGLPMVRATNTGLSSSISIYEREDFEKEVENNFFAEVNVPLEPRQSFFVLTYPFMQWIWGLIFVIALVWKFRDPTRKIFWTKSLK
jgi:apolipoprotein N-acyltransferase